MLKLSQKCLRGEAEKVEFLTFSAWLESEYKVTRNSDNLFATAFRLQCDYTSRDMEGKKASASLLVLPLHSSWSLRWALVKFFSNSNAIPVYVIWQVKTSLLVFFISNFYNYSLMHKIHDNRWLVIFGNCFKILPGWLELLWTYRDGLLVWVKCVIF